MSKNNCTATQLVEQPHAQSGASLGTIVKIVSTVSHSRKIRYYLQSLARQLLPGEQVAKCLRQIAPGRAAEGVPVMYSAAKNRAWYGNLIICNRLWFCPVCAARITEHRRRELSLAIAAVNGKYRTVLVTYTLRHNHGDALSRLLAGLLDAFRAMKQGRQWMWLKSEFSWVGSVRSLEVTHGDNGWHVHIHELVFLDASLEEMWLPALETNIKKAWSAALEKHGLDASWERGVLLEAADDRVREYVAKFGHDPVDGGWTIEDELTKAAAKMGRVKGRTPFQLLSDYGDGDMQAGRLFQEYAGCFKGRNQLVWSPGLRALLELGGEKSDDELPLEGADELAVQAGLLAVEQWRQVLVLGVRAEFLEVVERSGGDWSAAWAWLSALGVPEVVRVDATELMWSEYEKRHKGA